MTTLLIIGAIFGGFGLAFNQTAKKRYLDKCGTDAELSKNHDVFMVVFSFGGILATLIALPLLADSKVRVGLYVILAVLCANAMIMQIRTSHWSRVVLPEPPAEGTGSSVETRTPREKMEKALAHFLSFNSLPSQVWSILAGVLTSLHGRCNMRISLGF